MYSSSVIGTFVSQKINKIRWIQEQYVEGNSFLTGSWENSENSIRLWSHKPAEDDSEVSPEEQAEIEFSGDVTELLLLKNNTENFVASSSNGDVKQYRISRRSDLPPRIMEVLSWKSLHKWKSEKASCTGLDVYDGDIVTVGEDGRINLLTANQRDVVCTINDADSCTITCVCFLKHNEILTGNLRGQMRSWDIRCPQKDAKVESTFMKSGDHTATTCITHHPTQRHMVLAGNEDGSMAIWDLRLASYPVSILSAHQDSITELKFHPDRPNKLFSSSANGELWHWDAEKLGGSDGMAWLNSESSKQKLQVFALISGLHKPINTLDLNREKAICGCDNEAVYLMNNIFA